MEKTSRIYVAGHKGLVGSALIRMLKEKGYTGLIIRTSEELDLRRQADVESFFDKEHPDYVFLAAAKVGGIHANNTYKAEFIYDNITIAGNVINSAYKYGVKKLLNLGSSCIYPKFAPQPLKEEYLLTGELEPTNEPYAIAKITAIKLCRYYNEQYGTDFLSVMPTNLYGPNDNYNLETSHVLPALIRKFYLAKWLSRGNFEMIFQDLEKYGPLIKNKNKNHVEKCLSCFGIEKDKVVLWGTGLPYREFLHVDDLADACVFLMQTYGQKEVGEIVNIGSGKDMKIRELAELIRDMTGFNGDILWDNNRPDGVKKKMLDVSKIKRLGWQSSIDLETGIKKTLKFNGENKI